ncbi:DUF3021 domain-containing protein [Oenococcus sp.]|uniref:DUF3021 domain-containing protein n=1 Tax=Oenococcus sp. TaxID=1979414 RepID=UPI0039E7E3A6
MLKKVIRYILIGIGFASSIYLIGKLFSGSVNFSKLEIASTLLMGALIGLVSMIFELDDYLNFASQLVIHFVLTAALVFVYSLVNHFLINSWGMWWLTFVIIYIGVWVVVTTQINQDVLAINRKLQSRHHTK